MAGDSSLTEAGQQADGRQRILLVTGVSGAGKTTALRVLEDLGWEAIDNFPIRLLGRLLGSEGEQGQSGPLAIGFDSRTRGFVPASIIDRVKKLSQRPDLLITTLFIDCGSGELERRYNETRRRHPMASGRPVHVGIHAERELLEPLRRWADAVIDTTDYTSNDLQQAIREGFAAGAPQDMSVILSSFGFARGTPPLADLVFDMRFLDNPHWIEGLREQTGLDAPVAEHIQQDPAFDTAFRQIRELLLTLLPRYRAQGKSYVHIAFGCTGGRHRSVFAAAKMDEALRKEGFSPTVIHRNLGSRAADEIEGPKA
ncbi:RNase adapter RapZ [Parerythrobacter lacustris]|uniref:RNase adapter RapZ n=1 Tax=Parerythrobacter lacustris TaxID=2969984 RepID=A0ABT1XVK5_9SPHN|nr:RNase adapter RapZ [Parerythrobacter lacustris]MCR2834976.1 RNase adapter RapZ [Parerythrobacter lacustris]